MADDIIFANGVIYKPPRTNAPDFVKGALSFKVDEAIQFLKDNTKNGWCNCNILISKSGKPYVALDTWVADPNYNKGKPNVNSVVKEKKPDSAFGENPVDHNGLPIF
jgi:hypothetical protein